MGAALLDRHPPHFSTDFYTTRISTYHGGDFAGLSAHLDYIQKLGVTAIWISPPFRNKPMQDGTAGYHGYWILDFLHIDPHLGTEREFQNFVQQAHARGMRVYLDIVVNHTADVIHFDSDTIKYKTRAAAPYRDVNGREFDERQFAYNGVRTSWEFPTLSPPLSFPYLPMVSAEESHAKEPEWLNDLTLYHNRGNSTFHGEDSVLGDFFGLDDLFTENPRVVKGMIEIFSDWIVKYGIDGFRIDTARHVNAEFWQAFVPALRARARQAGRTDFLQFGEVAIEPGDPAYLSEFSTAVPLDSTLDFGFFSAARRFISQGGSAAELTQFFEHDDDYTDHDSNIHSTVTFLGNHDAGRFAGFLQRDNPGASRSQIADLWKLGHALLLLSRGQPALYYGDEQGMVGMGDDKHAREDMFASKTEEYRNEPLLGTTRTGADDKFDLHHPFFDFIRRLAQLRAASPAFRTGAMLPRKTAESGLFAFSRIERTDLIEFLVVFNNSRTQTLRSPVPTSQAFGATMRRILDSNPIPNGADELLKADGTGGVKIALEPLQFAVFQADAPLLRSNGTPIISFVTPAPGSTLDFVIRETDGQRFSSRQELRVNVGETDGYAEVTFLWERKSRPGQFELVGVDDTVPFRVYWRPPPDLAPDEEVAFMATVTDLRGHGASTRIGGFRLTPSAQTMLAANTPAFGTHGALTPKLSGREPAFVSVQSGGRLHLSVSVLGTEPLEYQWLHDGEFLPHATNSIYFKPNVEPEDSGEYRILVHNLAGSTLSSPTRVEVFGAKGR